MAGAVGGMLIAKVTASILQATGSYVLVFFIAGSAYLDRAAGDSSARAEARAGGI